MKCPFVLYLHSMKYFFYILLLTAFCNTINAQTHDHDHDHTHNHDHDHEEHEKKSLSLGNALIPQNIPDSLLVPDSSNISTRPITAYALTPHIGDRYIAPMDTNRLNTHNSVLVDGKSLSMAYLSNLGAPHQTRIFSERKEAGDFVYADAYDGYITNSKNALFYDTKIPYTNVSYTTTSLSSGGLNKEEHFKAMLTSNFGKKINIGGDFDYIYGRGFYNSNGTKLLSYRFFGSYRTDEYELNAFIGNFNFINGENGGLTDITYVTKPEIHEEGKQKIDPKSFPTRYSSVWNRVRGKQIFLTHRYNLGFTKAIGKADEEGNREEIFVPVSSIIHTVDYEDNRRHFYSSSTAIIDTTYKYIYNIDPELADQMSSYNLKNTFALSLREGFQDWVKMGFTAFARFEKRAFRLQAPVPGFTDPDNPVYINDWYDNPPSVSTLDYARDQNYNEFSTYIGAEISKRRGSLLTYNARGEICLVGDDIGEFRAAGELKTQFNLLNKNVAISAIGELKNVTPAFFLRHHHSRYFWWDKSFSEIQHVKVGGKISYEKTNTELSAFVESLQNYVYIGSDGTPQQHGSNLQVITLRAKQNFYYKAFAWENELAYQLSSDNSVLPLPTLAAYSNVYLHTKAAKVLTVQLGVDASYFTEYDAPYYEPATQQFQLQPENMKMKVGNYPLVNGYVNFHLKQTRFFIMMYNMGSMFIEPNYFSLANYALNPSHIKFGLSVKFNN